jgi:hypothetical protein
MKKLFVVTAFAAFVLAAHSAAGCDWNREASASDQAVAAADQAPPQTTPTCSGPNCPAPRLASASSEQPARAPDERAPIVLTNTRD